MLPYMAFDLVENSHLDREVSETLDQRRMGFL